jgi:hypothetical protein
MSFRSALLAAACGAHAAYARVRRVCWWARLAAVPRRRRAFYLTAYATAKIVEGRKRGRDVAGRLEYVWRHTAASGRDFTRVFGRGSTLECVLELANNAGDKTARVRVVVATEAAAPADRSCCLAISVTTEEGEPLAARRVTDGQLETLLYRVINLRNGNAELLGKLGLAPPARRAASAAPPPRSRGRGHLKRITTV